MKKIFFQINIALLMLTNVVFGQQSLKIGEEEPTTIDANAVLELQSTTKGMVLPRVATTSAILLPENGLMVYDSSTNCVKSYNNGYWSACLSGGLNQTSNGTAVISSINCASDPAFNGNITLPDGIQGVVQHVTAVVTSIGTYNFSTNTVNGMYFQLSGTFTIPGAQEITLIGFGSPIAAGNFTYTLNSNPGCTFDRIAYYMATDIEISTISPYFITSVYDTNYLPFTAPTGVATLDTGQAPGTDNTTDPTLSIQGSLSTDGVTITIPYLHTSYYSHIIPAFSQTIFVPAGATNDGFGRNVTLSFSQTQSISTNGAYGTIIATLKAEVATLNVKRLDMQTGFGSDYNGYLLGTFLIPSNLAGVTIPLELRIIPPIPDRSISAASTATATSHSMFYTPIRSATGKTWLNNNLGADYSNVYKSVFSPAQQATSATDYKAFGSLIQWGRNTDGHELTNWSFTNVILGPAVTIPITAVSTTSTTTNGAFIKNANWLNLTDYSLWQGVDGTNNPCPTGYRVPTTAELGAEMTAASILTTATAYNSVFKFTTTNYRLSGTGVFDTQYSSGYYWASEFTGTSGIYSGTSGNKYTISSIAVSSSTSARGQGFAVRCIKD